MKRFFAAFAFLLVASGAFGALTERYVTSTGTDTYANSTNSATPMSLTTAFANAVAGDRINIKADGTYTRAGNDTVTNAGTVTSPIIFRGYKTTIGDGNLGRTNGNGALILTNVAVISYNSTFKLIATSWVMFESLDISGTVSAATVQVGSDGSAKSCKISNASTNSLAAGILTASNSVIVDSDIQLTGASGGSAAVNNTSSTNTRIAGNRIKGGPAVGVMISTGSPIIIGNVIFGGVNGITCTSTGRVASFNNTITGNSGDGVDITGTATIDHIFLGNIITDNGGYGIDYNAAGIGTFNAYNRYRDNASGATNLATDWIAATDYGKVTTDTGGPETDYVNSAGNDYRLIKASPATGTGWFPYASIGALQRQESGETSHVFVQ